MTGGKPEVGAREVGTHEVGRAWRGLFLAVGLLNILGGTLGLLDPTRPWTDQGMAEPVGDVILRLLYCTVILFGIGYLMVWRHPLRHRGIVVLGLGTKILGLVFTYWAIAEGQMPQSLWLQPLVADLPWAIGFAWFLWRFRHVPADREPDGRETIGSNIVETEA